MSEALPVRIVSSDAAGHKVQTVEVAGVNLADISRAFRLSAAVDSIVTLELDMFAMHGFDVTLPAAVTVNIYAGLAEDEMIEETTMSDSVKRYRVVKKDAA
jgi:hypothetical protein